MYKVSLDLGRVNKYLKLKFSLILKGDNQRLPLLNKFDFKGNTYLKISPIPMVSLEIKSNADKNEDWNPNKSLCFSKASMFIFCKRLKEIIDNFRKIKELFYYEGDKLSVNKKIAEETSEIVRVGNKVCKFLPVVVEDEESSDVFEGAALFINSPENYCLLTFEEMEYLLHYLSKLDLDQLSLQVINTSHMCNNIEKKKLDIPKKLMSEKIEEVQQTVNRFPKKSDSTIPDI